MKFKLNKQLVILFASLLLGLLQAHSAGTFRVTVTGSGNKNGDSWSNAMGLYQFLTKLEDNASNDEFWVAAGEYNFFASAGFIRVIANKKVYGGFIGVEANLTDRNYNTHKTVFKGTLSGYYVMLLDRSCGCVIDGVTITGSGNPSATTGSNTGGVLMRDGVLRNCIIENNYSPGAGAGVYMTSLYQTNRPLLDNCIIRNNVSWLYGGGVYIYRCGRINNCTITSNIAGSVINPLASSSAGGGIYYTRGENGGAQDATYPGTVLLEIDSTTVSSNKSGTLGGGGIYIEQEDVSPGNSSIPLTNALVLRNIILLNETGGDGGGLLSGRYGGFFVNNRVVANKGSYGGGFCTKSTYTSAWKIVGNEFRRNNGVMGGAICLRGNADTLVNNTISQNISNLSGPAIHSNIGSATLDGSIPYLFNNILYFNYDIAGTTTQMSFFDTTTKKPLLRNNIISNWLGYNTSQIVSTSDPMYSHLNNDIFNLAPCSPAKNTGENSIISLLMAREASVGKDLEGNPRFFGNVDIGAFELQTSNPTISMAASITAVPGTTVISGTNVQFTANSYYAGNIPSYQWKLNGVNVGNNSPTYSNNSLTNNSTVSVTITSSFPCVSPGSITAQIPVTVTGPLPVKVDYFNGKVVDNGDMLEWKTLMETHLKEFYIQRSIDGRQFASIATVAGKGANGNGATYRFTAPFRDALAYYRMQMVDHDGHTEYSGTVSLKRPGQDARIVLLNPVVTDGRLEFGATAPVAKKLTMAIFDINGRMIKQSELLMQLGCSTIYVDVPIAAKGMLFIKFVDTRNGTPFTFKALAGQ